MDAAGRDAARVSGQVLRQTIDLVCNASFADQIAGSRVPTLVVGGLQDWMFTPQVMRDGVAGPLDRARLELLDCGHEIPIEMPQELAQLVAQFVPECTHSPAVPEVAASRAR